MQTLFDLIPCAFLGLFLLIIFLGLFITLDTLVNSHPHRRDFDEPQSDTVFEADERGPELLEIDTLGDPTPPSEIAVHRYKWMPALGAYEYLGQIPLSQYLLTTDDEEIEQVLSRGKAPPVTWDHQVIYPDAAPAPCPFRYHPAHGNPLS